MGSNRPTPDIKELEALIDRVIAMVEEHQLGLVAANFAITKLTDAINALKGTPEPVQPYTPMPWDDCEDCEYILAHNIDYTCADHAQAWSDYILFKKGERP